jgi:hypothetical protein
MILFACLPFVYGLLFRSLHIVSLCACETNGDVVSLSATTNFYVSHLVVITYPDCMQESLQFSVNCVGKKSDSWIFCRWIKRVAYYNPAAKKTILCLGFLPPAPGYQMVTAEWAEFPHVRGEPVRPSDFPGRACFPGFSSPSYQTSPKYWARDAAPPQV